MGTRFDLKFVVHNTTFIFVVILSSLFMSAKAHTVKIGAIIDANSTLGKAQKAAMELAIQRFNTHSTTHQMNITFKHPRRPLPFFYSESAEELVKVNKVNVIIGMNRWEEAVAVADTVSQNNLPVISFSSPILESSAIKTRWPNIVRMDYGQVKDDMNIIAAILRTYNWTKIVPIYEQNMFGGDSGSLAILQNAIRAGTAEVDYTLAIPPLSQSTNPKSIVQNSLSELAIVESQVYIVLEMSMDSFVLFFEQANAKGFLKAGTVWILSNSVTDYLDLIRDSDILTMRGVLGIKSFYRRNSDVDHGFYESRASDSITVISEAIENLSGTEKGCLESKLEGVSRQLFKNTRKQIINVVGKKYIEIKKHSLKGPVIWPGDTKNISKGWTLREKLKVGVPVKALFESFVSVTDANNGKKFNGFCIELFNKVEKKLGYHLNARFIDYNGSYDELVDLAHNKDFHILVGDFTILSDRSSKIVFTPAYMESSLSMIVRAAPGSEWTFLKPFTNEMWGVTGALLAYIVFVVWFIERRGPDFSGSCANQIGTAIFFTLSSLFFAQREKLKSALTRLVILCWLFTVFVLSASYTANLTTMITMQQLQPSVTDIKLLAKNHSKVGCNPASFLGNYLMKEFGFNKEDLVDMKNESDHLAKLESGEIKAVVLERPYQKAFFNLFSPKKFVPSKMHNFSFGGLAFGFAEKSRLYDDFSKALLELKEKGEVKKLDDKYFTPKKKSSSDNENQEDGEPMGPEYFTMLYIINAGIATMCMVLVAFRRARKYIKEQRSNTALAGGKVSPTRRTCRCISFVIAGEDKTEQEDLPPCHQQSFALDNLGDTSDALSNNHNATRHRLSIQRIDLIGA